MHYIITFESGKFDLATEKQNPINPIHGISLGEWLSPLLTENGIEVSKIDAEDWGWYLHATFNDRKYLLGFVALPDTEGKEVPELIIQIDNNRSFIECLTFKNKMNKNDGLLKLVHQLVRKIEDAKNIEVVKVG